MPTREIRQDIRVDISNEIRQLIVILDTRLSEVERRLDMISPADESLHAIQTYPPIPVDRVDLLYTQKPQFPMVSFISKKGSE